MKKIIKTKMEDIERVIGQYKEGLISGAEALLFIAEKTNDPTLLIIHQYDTEQAELYNKTMDKIKELEGA